MGLLNLLKRIDKGSYTDPTKVLSSTEVDSNWQKIMDLFPTPASGNTDVGKVPVLKSDKTGFEYAEPISNGVSKINNLKEDVNITAGTNINIETDDINNQIIISAKEFNVLKDGALVGQSSSLNFKGAPVTVTNDPINNKIDVEVIGGGGQIAFTKTKAEIDTLIAGNDLVAGAMYEITGVHPTLYNDGTNSGTTIYLKAITENTLEVQGTGKFYNPKYNQAVDGFGIWENKMYGTFSNIVGVFDYQNKEAVTANNAATGIILADGMIQWVSGDWSTATSITGDVSGATADVADFVSPSYGVGDKVIWGGYSWTNANGNVGASVDVLNLDAEWTKNVYDTTNYNIAYDLIEYDYANDMIIRRFEKESNVDVKCSKAQYDFFVGSGFPYHSISVQQFGNVFNTSSFKGQINILCNNGYNESINFIGSYQRNLTFGSNANQANLTFGSNANQDNLTFGGSTYQRNLTFGSDAYQANLTFGSNAYQYNLTFGSNAHQANLTFGSDANQRNLTFGSGSGQGNITFGSGSYQDYLTFENNSAQFNLTFGSGSYQSYLTFGSGSGQYNLTFGINSYQNNLTFGSNSNQGNLTFGNNSSQYNLTFENNSSQNNLTFGSNSYQGNLTFGSGSNQQNLTFGNGSNQYNLTFGRGSQLNYNSQVISSNMQYITFNTKGVTVPDLSAATLLFDGNIKEVYQRPDGALKIRYYDNSDTLVIAGIAD